MSIFEYNGSGIVAMKGKNCVALGADMRLGARFSTIANNFQKVFVMQKNIILAIGGLATDVQTFHKKIKYRLKMYQLREKRLMKVETFGHLVGSTLFESRFSPFLVNPIVVGLKDDLTPYAASYDLLGSMSTTSPYAAVGTANMQFMGMCESYYNPERGPEELSEVVGSVLLSGTDKDILSGWGAVVFVI